MRPIKKIETYDNISNYFNEYFCQVGHKISKNIKIGKTKINRHKRTNKSINMSMFIRPVTCVEVKNVIEQLKNKSGGVDGIHALTIKTLAYNSGFVQAITHIVNLSFSKGTCPEHFKIAEVVPVFKNGDKHQASNYRPISLISNLSKIWEKLLHSRILNFLNKHNIISKLQYGFCKGKGTKEALAKVTEIIYNALDSSRPIAAIFLDLAKAFGAVNHEILIHKLANLGFRGLARI